jgi:hypothetical protein
MKPNPFLLCFFIAAGLLFSLQASSQTTLIPYITSWKYLDNNTRPAGWETTAFNDASWASGNAELGYGDGDEATTVSFGGNTNAKFITTYFRKTINIADPSLYSTLTFNVERDDGVVVYLNGTEIGRNNMPTGTIGHSTTASSAIEDAIVNFTAPATGLVAGNNVIAVEVHQANATSSDLSFQLELTATAAPLAVLPYNSSWKYLVTPAAPAAGWNGAAFDDAAWPAGNAELGYGDGGEATVVGFGPDANNKYVTTYFRKTVSITNLASIGYFTLSVIRDDGVVVYVNGTEVARNNLPAGSIAYSTLATAPIGGADETTAVTFSIPTTAFVEGDNVIAVEMHQSEVTSSDLSFNLRLVANGATTAALTRGPYLQMGTQTGITLRWRTDVPTDSRVELGTADGVFTISQTDPAVTTEHIVRVEGLTPDTKYFYSVGSTTQTLMSGTNYFVRTVPPRNAARKFSFAVFGDCGRNDMSFRSLSISHYQSYLASRGMDAADGWLLLGDNAYTNGTDTEYQNNFFTPFQSNLLRNHKLYPAPGNHDYYSTSQTSRSGSYYQSFTLPTNGECGGVASGAPAYYSYDIGNVHFLSLDSYGTEAGSTRLYDTLGPQVTWIKADLAANTNKWVVAYWHHPPYTMGSHNSDSEGDLAAIRNNLIRILERYGVDLILCGHSHDYERSYLLSGHYGTESSFNVGTHAKSNSSGRYNGTTNSCPYTTASNEMNHGTVYVVAGSSGADGGVQAGYPHNALPFSIDDGGMFFFEAEDNRLDAKFIRRDGSIADQFTIMQDVSRSTSQTVAVGSSVTLTASWVGSYLWSTGATTRSITVTPATEGTTNYTVTDASSGACLNDAFTVNASSILPVSFAEFSAGLRGMEVELRWRTTREENNRGFTVERSANATDFQSIGFVAGAGRATGSSYSYTDRMPLRGESFYRLRQQDRDDRSSYSAVRRVMNSFYAFDIKGVKVQGGRLQLEVVSGQPDGVQLEAFDLSGRTILRRRINVIGGESTVTAELSNGNYIIQLTNSQGRKLTRKVAIL